MAEETKIPYDAGEETQVKARKRRSQIIRDQQLSDIASVASSPEGRRFLWRMWEEARVFQCTHTPGDPCQTAFNEGHRNLGRVFLMDVFEACPDRFREAQAEAQKSKEDDSNG